jgi:HD-like signal output (HDOD) protein/CheY-like chemotaxis protein
MTTRVLFVDDDTNVLAGLRRMIHSRRDRITAIFVSSGADALLQLASDQFAVLVTDLQMPGMDGAELLEQVREQHPQVIRIVLSGQVEDDKVLRVSTLAHQFLSKPCDLDELLETIENVTTVLGVITDPELLAALGRLDTLPTPSPILLRLTEAISRPDADPEDIITIIADDPSITLKLLQLVNSSFFGLPRHIAELREAVLYLGLRIVRDLVATTEVFKAFEQHDQTANSAFQRLYEDVTQAGRHVSDLCLQMAEASSNAQLVGLVHDIGSLALATCAPNQCRAIHERAIQDGRSLHVVETEMLGVSHAEVGAYLLSVWGFQRPVIEAVALHHEAPDHPDAGPLTHILFVAVSLWSHSTALGTFQDPFTGLEPNYLDRHELATFVKKWQDAHSGRAVPN